MSWVPTPSTSLRANQKWLCDNCGEVFHVKQDGQPRHVRQQPRYQYRYYYHVWRRAYPSFPERRGGDGTVNNVNGHRYYCSKECVEPLDLEEVRLALLYGESKNA